MAKPFVEFVFATANFANVLGAKKIQRTAESFNTFIATSNTQKWHTQLAK
jgi:hypothetical protein